MANTGGDKKKNILVEFFEFFYGNAIVLILGFISLPLMTRILSTPEYGRSSLFLSAVSIIYIFAILGLDQSYIRYFYSDRVDRRKLFSDCLTLPLVLIIILAVIYLAFSDFFNGLLFEKTGRDVTALVIGYTVTSVFERFLFLNIRMEQRGKLYSNLNIATKCLNIGFIILFAHYLGDDFRVGLYSQTLPLMIITGGLLAAYLYRGRGYRPGPHDLSRKEILGYGIPFVPMLLMEWLLSSMDKWSIRFLGDFAQTEVYSSAMQIMTILLTLKITYVAFWAPIAMKKYEQEDEEKVKPFFADMYQKMQFLCMLAAFGITAARSVIVLILGEKYREASKIIPFLALMPVLSILFEMTGQGIKFKKKPVYFNYASAVAIVCNLTGNLLLVPRLGGVGAAIATAFTYIVYFGIGTCLSEKLYPAGYDHRKFGIALTVYTAYAAYATVCAKEWENAAVGAILIIGLCLMNKKTVAGLLRSLGQALKGFLRKDEDRKDHESL